MKKMLVFVLIFIFCYSVTACKDTVNEPTDTVTEGTENTTDIKAPGEGVFYGMIVKNMDGTLLVTQVRAEGETSSLYTLSADYLTDSQDENMLVPGTYFTLYYDGYIMESYPAQFGAPVSFTCTDKKEDLVTPLTDFVLEKIPGDAQWIALDLSGVAGLTKGEIEAIEYLLMCEKMDECSVVRFDAERLTAENLLTADGSPENGSVLRVEAELENGKLTGKWRLTDAERVTESELSVSVPYYLN